jgi:hypothetical protein
MLVKAHALRYGVVEFRLPSNTIVFLEMVSHT